MDTDTTIYTCKNGRLRLLGGAEAGSDIDRLASIWTRGGMQGIWAPFANDFEVETEEGCVSLSAAAYADGVGPHGVPLALSERYPYLLSVDNINGVVMLMSDTISGGMRKVGYCLDRLSNWLGGLSSRTGKSAARFRIST